MDIFEVKNKIEDIIYLIDTSLNELNSASNWGLYDIFKGGMFISLIKNSKISDAERNIHRIESALFDLEEDLKDITIDNTIDLDISDFLKFTDIFMDNVFSDIMVQGKIRDATYDLKELRRRLKDLYRRL